METAEPPAPAGRDGRPLAARLWEYQAERFPVFKHGALIVAFGTSAVCVSALLRDGTPSAGAMIVAVVALFCFFVQLRVADEHKDHADDVRYRPKRPVPRGLISLKELRWVAWGAAGVTLAATWWLDWRLTWLLLAVWGWMALMTKEFFAPDALKARPLLYMVSHMAVMPLIDLYATATDWLPAGVAPGGAHGGGLAAFLLLSLANGVGLEIARKAWAPEDEREGVETYSKLWGVKAAGYAAAAAMFAGLVLSAYVHVETGAHPVFLAGLLIVAAIAVFAAIDYAAEGTRKTAQRLELVSGIYVLGNYILLGVGPMAERVWLS